MKSTIAIIGATGSMGSALARKLAKAGYPLLLMGRGKEKLQLITEEIKSASNSGVEAIGCAMEAAWEADMIIPAVPYTVQAEVAAHIRPVAVGKIVISVANPFHEYAQELASPEYSAAEELQRELPHSKIVKAFNTVLAADLNAEPVEGIAPDCFIAGDDASAVEAVSQLVKDAGLAPLIAGRLDACRTLERMMKNVNNNQ